MLIEHLKTCQPSLMISMVDELCVRIAALCHDLGHGPFSHLFEQFLDKLESSKDWKHEMASLAIFDKMIEVNEGLRDEFEAFGLFEMDRKFIKDLIFNPALKSFANMDAYENNVSNELVFTCF